MAKITIKGHEFEAVVTKDNYNRRALQFKNNIIAQLKRLGISIDDIDIELEANVMKKAQAKVDWYFDGRHLHYSHNLQAKYVDNLYVVLKVIENEINDLVDEKITVDEFVAAFHEDDDVHDARKEARKTLGLAEDEDDIKAIDIAYKNLAREHHPDNLEKGDTERFKEINKAHKILKRELK